MRHPPLAPPPTRESRASPTKVVRLRYARWSHHRLQRRRSAFFCVSTSLLSSSPLSSLSLLSVVCCFFGHPHEKLPHSGEDSNSQIQTGKRSAGRFDSSLLSQTREGCLLSPSSVASVSSSKENREQRRVLYGLRVRVARRSCTSRRCLPSDGCDPKLQPRGAPADSGS